MSLAHAAAADGEAETLALMRATARRFCARLLDEPGIVPLPAPALPDHGTELHWRNTLFSAPGFRRAHVELLEIDDHFAVVHVVVLPNLCHAAPIFGFDMIAGRTQATGIFLDFSPATAAAPLPSLGEIVTTARRCQFARPRIRPDWGSIFSPDFFAIRPYGNAEIRAALAIADQAFDHYLCNLIPADSALPADPEVASFHAAYASAQRLNPHTERMLARFVGAAAARAFIDDVLFPLPA